ncbi:caspase family protein [Achromobacter seleniivolatilans]|uniref:Caspase family protein n=1 Tax=Achromobacter seleniivolatilans TaxID=3047478 RepID=A0ABY9LYB0_9BURK|nr:caspase family protein [Achromobacter sp. R39]WMD19754.1 caspase family protein [Achromobacter sp. R39]
MARTPTLVTKRRQLLTALLGAGLLGVNSLTARANPASTPVPAKRRHALVIGNARYAVPANALVNPVNDARLIAETLRKRNFDVTLLTDLTTPQMENAVDEFATRATNAELAMVYFAGHAVAVDDVNYLFGVELAVPLGEVRIRTAQQSSLSLRRVSQALRRANIRARLLVLDACRTNLTRGAASPGLIHTVPAGGELIAFSTQPGATAEDGFGKDGPRHSPYAFYFAQGLDALPATAPVENFFKQLTGDVQVATAHRQVPHYASSLVGTVTFTTLADAQTPAVPGAAASGQAAQAGRGPSPTLGRDLIRARMSAWEYEIERGAQYLDEPRLSALQARAKAGDVVAMTTLGLIAENGEHVEQDYKAAARWYQRAADQGFAPAQTYLGELTGMGRGVPKNYNVAERLFREAAEAGHHRATLDLLDLRVRMGEPMDPREWATALQDAARNPAGLPLPGMPPIQGLPDMPWMRALGVRPPGQP